jgi:hypothetical protein
MIVELKVFIVRIKFNVASLLIVLSTLMVNCMVEPWQADTEFGDTLIKNSGIGVECGCHRTC